MALLNMSQDLQKLFLMLYYNGLMIDTGDGVMYYVNDNVKDLYRVKFHDERGGVLRLDMNENPEGLPKDVFDKIWKKVTPEYIATYPEKDRLMETLARHDGTLSENISVTAGSDEAMRLIFQCFGEAGKELLTVLPTFEMYDVYSKMFGMNHVNVDYKEDFTLDANDILDAVNENTGIVILLNPNSPIGTVYNEKEVRAVIEKARKAGALVVIDEAYHYFYEPTFLPLIKEYDNLLILRTFSKLFSMAGLRIGYVSGNAQLISYIEKAESTFNVNNIAILFAQELISDEKLIQRLLEAERAGKEWLTERLKEAGYRYVSKEGNYVLFYPRRESKIVVEELKKQDIWVRDYGSGILKGWMRASIGSVACMQRFWEAFMEADREETV